jgi:hypothetical protein
MDEFSEWLLSSNLTEYSEKFSENGFDDLNLLKSMDEGEISSMIEDIGIEKRGHIIKLKKCLCTSQWNTPHPPTRGTAGH